MVRKGIDDRAFRGFRAVQNKFKTVARIVSARSGSSNWARQFIEKEFVGTEHRLISSLSMTATERYLRLMKEKPEILQRVQLRHIASYLGISSEHLSRIRASTKSMTI